ncbi:phosphoesterase family protein [Methyloglobulus morosus KoM1]|uniref:Phosphoesterase family protein n=1 Tax=Methyloglobulus morosus KoM1 TaxID=1116472 RepID=V5BZE3_9GAMM|nr:alkaline phosphatase family protein [Methyloglobulus morosus]ESS73194.1 phosphoesterase family protein [Methyloglobulus morosus KoM1]
MTSVHNIEHFVVLMLENRSFDNLLGSLYPKSKNFNGVDGSESNKDRSGKVWPLTVTKGGDIAGLSVPNPDPGELWTDMNEQIFGFGPLGEAKPTKLPEAVAANMSGFVDSYTDPNGKPSRASYDPRQIMSRYDPDRDVPALAALARQFAVCDSWFASAPCQTWPNRLFLHTGTAGGYENNTPDALFFKMPTVFGTFDKAPSQPSWSIYHHDIPQTLTLQELVEKADKFHLFDTFVRQAKEGSLPNYSFIEPRYYSDIKFWPPSINLPNDMHPPHVVCFGDGLVASVYNALRSNEEAWKKTMLIIVFDEHGGCYDHAPPQSAVPPGPVKGDNPNPVFGFDRYGVRVPAVIASPYIQPGTILRPSDNYPEDGTTPFDHASVINTLRLRFDLGKPLTARVQAAPTLERVLNLADPVNLGPIEIKASECKVGLLYKIRSLFELWNDFQASLHDAARKLPKADDHGRAQVYIDRHETQSDTTQPDGATSDFGAIWRHAWDQILKAAGLKR